MEFIKNFFEEETPEQRMIRLSKRIRENNPEKIPVLIKTKNLKISKEKFVVSKDTTLGNFTKAIRKYVEISEKDALFLLIDNLLYTPNKTFKEIDTKEPYLTIVLCKEETYGSHKAENFYLKKLMLLQEWFKAEFG